MVEEGCHPSGAKKCFIGRNRGNEGVTAPCQQAAPHFCLEIGFVRLGGAVNQRLTQLLERLKNSTKMGFGEAVWLLSVQFLKMVRKILEDGKRAAKRVCYKPSSFWNFRLDLRPVHRNLQRRDREDDYVQNFILVTLWNQIRYSRISFFIQTYVQEKGAASIYQNLL